MLNGIHLVDFANHRDTRLTFGRMTALVGPNGAGKTSVMRALEAVNAPAALKKESAIDPRFARRGTKRAIVTASWTTSDPSKEVGLFLGDWVLWLLNVKEPTEARGLWVPNPRMDESQARSEVGDSFHRWLALDDEPEVPMIGVSLRSRREIEVPNWKCRYFKTSARALHRPSYSDSEQPQLNDEGSNLAWVLAYLMTADPDRFARIMDAVREVVPVIKRVRSRPVQLSRLEKRTITINKQERMFDEEQPVMGQELIFDMVSGTGLPATEVSEGTLVALAVLTLIYSEDSVDMIMLDDVELGLHPRAQRDLIKQLRRVQETHPNLQILVSTHSPYIVDEMKPEEVWMMAPDKEGCAVAKRLCDHPDAKRALEVLSTGEFWSSEGEGWVLESEPAPKVAETP